MSLGGERVAAELREHDAPLVVGDADGLEVDVQALELRSLLALIVPAAHAVDDAGGVCCAEHLGDLHGVELSPALVEGHPDGEGDHVFEAGDGVVHLGDILLSAFLVRAGEELILVVLEVDADEGQHAYRRKVVARAAGDHVLPHQHTLFVAVVVPPERLDLDVLADHVEPQRFDEFDVVFERGVGGGGEHAVRPIALVEHAGVEIGLVVEREALETLAVRHHGELAHPEIGTHDIVAHLDGEVVEFGIFGGPQLVVVEVDLRDLSLDFDGFEQLVAVHDGDVRAVGAHCVQLEDELVAVDVRDDGDVT